MKITSNITTILGITTTIFFKMYNKKIDKISHNTKMLMLQMLAINVLVA